jgi:hypothetical protein
MFVSIAFDVRWRICSVIAQIEQTAKQKLETALKSAQQLRGTHFAPQGGRQKRSRKKVAIKEPVLKATARLAA